MRKIKNFLHLFEAILANIIYGFPGRKMKIIGVTGTDGKTSTTHLIAHILKSASFRTSYISTVEANIIGKTSDTGFHVTTPSPFSLQRLVSKALSQGTEFLVLEITSHALDQYRNFGIDIDIAVITNISHEHLDYHKSMTEYMKTKAKILKKAKIAVLNRDDPSFTFLSKVYKGKKIMFSINDNALIKSISGINNKRLIGLYNKYNILASYSVAKILGIDSYNIIQAINSFPGIPGRLEKISNKKGINIYIDFAHKINALDNVLNTLKNETKNKLIAVFGAAGLRDSTKRPLMGEVAGKTADYVVITAEDPRTEDVRKISDSIADGCLKMKMKLGNKNLKSRHMVNGNFKYFFKISDRQEAINFAIRKLSKKGDTVVFCGKGHEKSMCYGTTEYPWDEKAAINRALYG